MSFLSRYREYFIPLALYGVAAAVAAANGMFVTWFPHEFWHFLPLQALLDHPLQSL